MGGAHHIKSVKEESPADRACRFINGLSHTKDQWAGKPFSLRPWQEQKIIRPLFGTLLPDKRRQYRTCYVEIPRKNGKTELAAAIALYMLLGDGTVGARVYSAAGDLEQASLAFDVAAQMVRNDRELNSMLEIIPSRKRIIHHATGSYYRAIPADAGGAHGFDASAIIADELHVWAGKNGRDLWTALRTSMGARRQPLIFVITTAGWDRTSLCWEMHEYAERVKATPALDPTFLPVLYGAPIDAPWDDETVWQAANPALGDYRFIEEMRIEARQAKEIPSRQNDFRQLYLCQWTEQRERWLDMAAWRRCQSDISDADLIGLPCYAGLDLGQTDDFSAFVRMWCLPGGKRAIRANFWIPQAQLTKNRHRPYGVWQEGGWLTVTQGQTCDYDQVEAEVARMCHESGVRILAYDKRFADQMRVHLEQQGITCVETPQGFALNEALTNLQTLVVEQKLQHDGNPIMDWHASNAVVRRGKLKGDIWLDKDQAGDKIDGMAALAMANNHAKLHVETSYEAMIL